MINENLNNYNIVWNTQSRDSGESMPLGARDIGCNVWVENDRLFVYMAQSGAFDSCGNMLKAGRLCISFDKAVFKDGFEQKLILQEGCITIKGKWDKQEINIRLWNEIFRSALHIHIASTEKITCRCNYENWRVRESENSDVVIPETNALIFYHRNLRSNMLESRLAEQEIEYLREYFPDVEKNRTCGGRLTAPNMVFTGKNTGRYLNTDFTGYLFCTAIPENEIDIDVFFHISQAASADVWKAQLSEKIAKYDHNKARKDALAWWEQFWRRSYVFIDTDDPSHKGSPDWCAGRNYQLFRYMLASNAYGEFPTKFNGGLFTVDQCAWHPPIPGANPDHRDWGGIMFTAQNQRLVYWPMIKNGDFDMMNPEFDFYKRLVTPLKKRTKHFFGLDDCACFPEQTDANGLSGFYGFHGVDYPLQVRHHYVEALEFSYMILCYHITSGNDISEYMEFIKSVINFYDKKYSEKDANGKRILFPSTALETYHADYILTIGGEEGRRAANYDEKQTAVTNPADVIAALSTTLSELLNSGLLSSKESERYAALLNELPEIPTEIKKNRRVIAPCEFPKDYKKGNCEFPQLNTVFPYKIYGVFSKDLSLATNTYLYGWDNEDQLDYISWHPTGCYAARIGLTEEAHKYMRLKLNDSERRFPAFWGPGHDYTPDFNWGGSGMINVQEMLVQTCGDKIFLLPSWPKNLDVSFKLWLDGNTVLTAEYKNGALRYDVIPANRTKDIVINDSFKKPL